MNRLHLIRLVFLFVIWVGSFFFVRASTGGNIKNFSRKVYGAANQNWSVDASPNGFIYFANHHGLLEFDGVSWMLHELPNRTILRSVRVVSDTLIYTGGYRELGFWKPGVDGWLAYHSLTGLAGDRMGKNDEFWNISVLNDTVYFHSFSKILVYRDNTISEVELPGFAHTMSRVGQRVLVAVRDHGIFVIRGSHVEPLITDSRLEAVTFRFLLPFRADQLLIGTASHGIFLWDGERLSEWNQPWSDYFRRNEVNRAYIDERGQLYIGTIIDGVTIFNRNGERLGGYNTTNGLQNNTVLGIASDTYGNGWLALDSGIDFISDDRCRELEIETIPGIGSIYDVAFWDGKIYLGTNRGLFFRAEDTAAGPYRLVPGTSGQVWDCHVHDNRLFVGYNGGVLTVSNGGVATVSGQAGGFCMREDPFSPGRLIESTYTSMVIIEETPSGYQQTGILKGFYDLIRYIEFDHVGNLWASHMHRGIYKFRLNSERDSIIQNVYFGENSVFGKDHSIHLFKVENRIVFTTEERLFTYNDLTDSIVPYDYLNEQLGSFAAAHRIVPAPDHHYWFVGEEKIGLFRIRNGEVQRVRSIPKELFSPHETVDDFENVLPLSSTEAVISLENGIARVGEGSSDVAAEIQNYVPTLREVTLVNQQGMRRSDFSARDALQVKYRYHNIRLRYAFPHYTHQPVYFQSFLQGIDPDWQEKSSAPVFSFDRLPAGRYELLVKAVDPWENESREHRLMIEVLPPWYLSNYAGMGYLLLFFLVMAGLQRWAVIRARRKERLKLEKREQELIRLRNEKLRNEVEHKSKELANSTMAIIKKNEFLMKLKEILASQKEQLGTRYPDKFYDHITRKIDDNISSHDDWHLFETNFERAHEKFLHKIKKQFPDLTPNDLRLCALLRMNLTSKEIAPLLGISVRGVENHRYRLRKKMELEHDDNLIDMILKL